MSVYTGATSNVQHGAYRRMDNYTQSRIMLKYYVPSLVSWEAVHG